MRFNIVRRFSRELLSDHNLDKAETMSPAAPVVVAEVNGVWAGNISLCVSLSLSALTATTTTTTITLTLIGCVRLFCHPQNHLPISPAECDDTGMTDTATTPLIRLPSSGGRVLKMVTEMGSATIGGISPALSANAAKSFLEATDKEKKELQGLNDRLGNYIDRVKRLEEQNRKLVADLDELRGKWGKDTSEIKIKYSESLSTARKDIDDSARRKAEIDVKVARLRDDLAEYRNR
ncbi:Intermediate filament protein ifb-1, variant 2, partial [Parelaphostrongylus tenuis]